MIFVPFYMTKPNYLRQVRPRLLCVFNNVLEVRKLFYSPSKPSTDFVYWIVCIQIRMRCLMVRSKLLPSVWYCGISFFLCERSIGLKEIQHTLYKKLLLPRQVNFVGNLLYSAFDLPDFLQKVACSAIR